MALPETVNAHGLLFAFQLSFTEIGQFFAFEQTSTEIGGKQN